MPSRSRPPQETSTVEERRADIERLVKSGAKPRSIYDWLKREREKFSGSYPAVKRLCRRLGAAQGWRSGAANADMPSPTATAKITQSLLSNPVRAALRVRYIARIR